MFRFPFNLFKFGQSKPRILLLADKRGWAFDHCAKNIAKQLSEEFEFEIRYVKDRPSLKAKRYDLIHVFFWGEILYRNADFSPERIIKEVSSHRWQDDPLYGPCTPQQFVNRYLIDAGNVFCTSERLFMSLKEWHPRVHLVSNGVDVNRFNYVKSRTGSLKVGWAGNINDPVKRVRDLLIPACEGVNDLRIANGSLSYRQMNAFYNDIDVFLISSKHEGSPLPLLEAMAAGCFPVAVNVGIVPEVIHNGVNGLIVEPTVDGFQAALRWCAENLEQVREQGKKNAELIRASRAWQVTAQQFRQAYRSALEFAAKPRFRNDDVSWDTPYEAFVEFCSIFNERGFIQTHGVVPYGRTCTLFRFDHEPVEYEGYTSISNMPNPQIRQLSCDFRFEERKDLIDYLNASPDDIALHGLYHTDFSQMSFQEQYSDIRQGLEILQRLFPKKIISYFIAPFNRTNLDTYLACRELGLTVLAKDGVHLESELEQLAIKSATWYRYHHHRFYPESTFDYYDLSLVKLRSSLA